jgi:hypothetical protein
MKNQSEGLFWEATVKPLPKPTPKWSHIKWQCCDCNNEFDASEALHYWARSSSLTWAIIIYFHCSNCRCVIKPTYVINLKQSLVLWPTSRSRLGSGLQVVLPLHHRLFTTRCMNSWTKGSWSKANVILPRSLSGRMAKLMRKSQDSRSEG